MNSLLTGAVLSVLTIATIGAYPMVSNALNAKAPIQLPTPPVADSPDQPPHEISAESTSPVIDVVFVLDTTGSMGGLIQTAKDKIWSIATTMSSAQQTPEIRIGLVAYRDRGDQYVTKVIDLSSDVDSVYANLMDFNAAGGGDGPESVNQALNEAVNKMSWSQHGNAYKTIFLVGDAPPHMDYKIDVQYPATVAAAKARGIVINAIQCGEDDKTRQVWQSIAQLGNGNYFQVDQAGSGIAIATPYDAEMAKLSAELDDTRMYYGTRQEKSRMRAKTAAGNKLKAESSTSALASRGAFNASAAGRKNKLGDQELVNAVSTGNVALEDIAPDTLPEKIRALKPVDQKKVIEDIARQRLDIESRLSKLSRERQLYLQSKVRNDAGAKESLDRKLYETVRSQAASVGLEYHDGPTY